MGIGPQLPPGFSAGPSSPDPDDLEPLIGPALPPQHTDSEVSIGPSLPPDLAQSNAQTKRRRMGPSMPSAPITTSYHTTLNSQSDSDDDVGPMPIPQEYADVVNEMELARTRQEIESRIENQRKADEDAAGTRDGVAVRGDWMLVPPEVKKLTAILGTEMKSRQFQRASTKEETVDQSGWTKLPGERSSDSLSRPSKRKLEVPTPTAPQMDPATQAAIDSYNKANRPKTLMEMHTTEYVQSSKFADNDASARKFDRDRDLSSRRTDSKARRDLVDGAKNLSSRFSGGGK
ncbi:hypothetical protein CcCBS67573_g06785 [Chytriomyces confervae]|uniref:DUF3752 domain-containing protein n=1 Tax=Chytriomyces confervae TaxID=246404 RepID=A0A507F2S8_9FUNG|nr:hypothetical protein CcCBS67573_g06785 [Chytriomyces confervae]